MKARILALAALALSLPAHPARAQHDTWALTNARIVTVSGPTVEHGTVVIRDGLIAAVGDDVRVPDDARVLDLEGMTLYPGLIDLQSTVGLTPPRRASRPAAFGSPPDTTGWQGLDPHRVIAEEFDRAHETVAQWRNAGVTTALVAPTRGAFRGQGVLVNLGSGDVGSLALDSRAAMLMGFEGVRGRYPATLMGVMAYQRQSLLDAQYLAHHAARYERDPRGLQRPDRDPRIEALVPYATGQGLVVIEARSERAIRRAVGLANEFGLNYVVSAAGEGWLALDVLIQFRAVLCRNLVTNLLLETLGERRHDAAEFLQRLPRVDAVHDRVDQGRRQREAPFVIAAAGHEAGRLAGTLR